MLFIFSHPLEPTCLPTDFKFKNQTSPESRPSDRQSARICSNPRGIQIWKLNLWKWTSSRVFLSLRTHSAWLCMDLGVLISRVKKSVQDRNGQCGSIVTRDQLSCRCSPIEGFRMFRKTTKTDLVKNQKRIRLSHPGWARRLWRMLWRSFTPQIQFSNLLESTWIWASPCALTVRWSTLRRSSVIKIKICGKTYEIWRLRVSGAW